MLDFNHSSIAHMASNDAINAEIDRALTSKIMAEEGRSYLGASALGHECLRKIQWDWKRSVAHEPRTQRIFDRGHWAEKYMLQCLEGAGFKVVRDRYTLSFEQMAGWFKGHADGMIIDGPTVVAYPCLWECKGLGSKGWNKLAKHGLEKSYPAYADQVALYQAYLDLTENPAIFTACNMDTMELLHLAVPFNAERAQAASDRAVVVIKAERAGETMPRVSDNADDWRCKLCSHKGECWK